jgi:hypothetical protein
VRRARAAAIVKRGADEDVGISVTIDVAGARNGIAELGAVGSPEAVHDSTALKPAGEPR